MNLQKYAESFLSLLFPPICLHCNRAMHTLSQRMCDDCLLLMELIDHHERCPYCFSSSYHPEQRICEDCQERPPILDRIAAAFDYTGPPATLVKQLKYGNQKYLSLTCAAYMIVQFEKLNWPMPDVIVPVPIAFNHWVNRGFNQCDLIANHLGEMLNRPVIQALKRRSGDFSQAGLTREQRMGLIGNTFELRKGCQFYDKTVLLVDDVITTGSTLRRCAEQLHGTYPTSIYALAVCHSDRYS